MEAHVGMCVGMCMYVWMPVYVLLCMQRRRLKGEKRTQTEETMFRTATALGKKIETEMNGNVSRQKKKSSRTERFWLRGNTSLSNILVKLPLIISSRQNSLWQLVKGNFV